MGTKRHYVTHKHSILRPSSIFIPFKGHGLDLPTITVCPKQASFRMLLINYFNKYYDHSDPESMRQRKNYYV